MKGIKVRTAQVQDSYSGRRRHEGQAQDGEPLLASVLFLPQISHLACVGLSFKVNS